MRLTILGSSPACQNPGGACSGYLIEEDGVAILIDCGGGVFSRLQNFIKPESLKAVVISHMHADHTIDLVQFRFYLFFVAQDLGVRGHPALFLPPDGHERLLALSRMQDQSPTFYSEFFALQEYDPLQTLDLGPLKLQFVPVVHIPHTYAIRITGSSTLAYSADTGPCPGLLEVARDADLFLCECANTEGSGYPFHLTPRQAGLAAQDAGVGELVLTHRWVYLGHESAVKEASRCYTRGPVTMAREDMQFTLGR
jgi:ribonuclease BN (tRNA processing enzyme)